MFTHYVPILKGKDGEYGALREASGATKLRFTPLIEIPPIAKDYDTDSDAKTIEEHVLPVAKKIHEAWGDERRFFLDFGWLDEDARFDDGSHPVTYVLSAVRQRGLQSVPVTGLARGEQFQDVIRDAIATDNRGACIRLDVEDFADLPVMSEQILELVERLQLSPVEIDLMVDLGSIPPPQVNPMILAARSILNALPKVDSWRSVTIAGSGFPATLASFTPNKTSDTPRTEWAIWNALRSRPQDLPRMPAFGDYTVNHPNVSDIDPKLMKMSAALRWTTANDWLVIKKRNVRDYGYGQFRAICVELVARPEYRGRPFSWGDAYVAGCAAGTESPGNAMIWRKIATSHHIAVVVGQIAS